VGYQGYYVATNLRLLPFPRLDLDNDASFYPYGTSQVFQPWGFERELFWAACYTLFGTARGCRCTSCSPRC